VSVSHAESNQPTSTDECLQHSLAPRGKFAVYYSLDRLFLLLIYRLHTRLTAVFRDCTGEPVPERQKTNLDFTEARDSEWQWHQLFHMQVSTSLQTDNHTSTPPLSFYRPDALPAAQPTPSKH